MYALKHLLGGLPVYKHAHRRLRKSPCVSVCLKPSLVGLPVYKHAPRRLRKSPCVSVCLKHSLGGLSAGQAPCGARHFPPDTPQVINRAYISANVWGRIYFRLHGSLGPFQDFEITVMVISYIHYRLGLSALFDISNQSCLTF